MIGHKIPETLFYSSDGDWLSCVSLLEYPINVFSIEVREVGNGTTIAEKEVSIEDLINLKKSIENLLKRIES